MSKRITFVVALAVLIFSEALGLRTYAAGDLSPNEALRWSARRADIELPSDACCIKEGSTTGNSDTAVSQDETAFHFDKSGDGKCRVADIRTGDRRWDDVDTLVKSLNSEKTSRAR